jgi:hypothetical protein
MALTVAQILDIARLSQALATLDMTKGALYGRRIAPETPQILYAETKAVEWQYNLDPANTSLQLTSNYLYSLCRGYNLQAQNISGTAGVITPVNPAQVPNPYDFVVTASSLIPDGGNSVIIPAYIGFNLLFVRNGLPQSMLNVSGNSYFSWNKNLGLLTISPAAYAGEQFTLYPV